MSERKKLRGVLLGSLFAACLALPSCGGGNEQTSSSDKEETDSQLPTETFDSSSESESSSSSYSSSSSSSSSEGGGSSGGISVADWDGVIRVYYHSPDGDEAEKAIYVWTESMNGVELEWSGESGSGENHWMYVDVDFSLPAYAGRIAENFYFIIKQRPGSWVGQSSDTLIVLEDFAETGELVDGTRYLYVYAVNGEGSDIDTFVSEKDALGDNIKTATLNPDWGHLDVIGSNAFASLEVYALSPYYYTLSRVEQNEQLDNFLIYDEQFGDGEDYSEISIELPDGADPQTTYRCTATFKSQPDRKKKKYATAYSLYDTDRFISDYTYDGDDLGMTYTPEKTTFKIWAPTTSRAQVYIYDYGTPKSLATDEPDKGRFDQYLAYTLDNLGHGVYGLELEGDLAGKFYSFSLTYDEAAHLSVDPYVKATGINGVRGAILDFDSTDPEGWNEVEFTDIESPSELTVYELHVRDLTSDDTWQSRVGNKRGTYEALVEEGTTYNGVTTGFDHLKELGVNAIQLLPVFDQDNEERTYDVFDDDGALINHVEPEYNWGYNPENYNVPEGSYASDPYDPVSRIKGLKTVIMKFAENDIRTIMDVVYNHVSSVSGHPFNVFAPRYYFHYSDDGFLQDYTGVNNSVKSERVMARRFIVDSVDWWAEEYKMMGFRFDLMGVLDYGTLREVKDSVYAINEDIVVYGEGWTGGGSIPSGKGADIYNTYSHLGDNGKGSVGVFNDCVRDGLKGNTVWANVIPSTGHFMDSASPSDDAIWNSATMYIGQNRARAQQGLVTPPQMSVNYISCHDNYTLYDQLNYQLHGQLNADKDHLDAIEATIASTATVLSSEGIAFIHAGEEIFRTKLLKRGDEYFEQMVESYGANSDGTSSWIAGDGCLIDSDTWLVRNSYSYGDEVNSFKWDRKYQFKEYYDKYVEAIHDRKQAIEDGYLGHTLEEINAGQVSCFASGGGTPGIGAYFQNGSGGTMIALLGGRCGSSVSINIPEAVSKGDYEIVYSSTGREQTSLSVGSSVTLSQYEALILRKA